MFGQRRRTRSRVCFARRGEGRRRRQKCLACGSDDVAAFVKARTCRLTHCRCPLIGSVSRHISFSLRHHVESVILQFGCLAGADTKCTLCRHHVANQFEKPDHSSLTVTCYHDAADLNQPTALSSTSKRQDLPTGAAAGSTQKI